MTTPADLRDGLARPDLQDRAKLVLLSLGLSGPATTAQLAHAVGRRQRTVQLALHQLSRAGLVQAQARGRQVWYAPVDNSATKVDDSRTIIRISQDRSHCAPGFAQPGASANAPTRTLWSSSSEEDVQQEKPLLYPPPPEGGVGEEAGGSGPLEAMRHWWERLAPSGPAYPVAWVQRLVRQFGIQIPMRVLQQFALADRTLADLEHPASYKSYFLRCCATEQDALEAAEARPEESAAGSENGNDLENPGEQLACPWAPSCPHAQGYRAADLAAGILEEDAHRQPPVPAAALNRHRQTGPSATPRSANPRSAPVRALAPGPAREPVRGPARGPAQGLAQGLAEGFTSSTSPTPGPSGRCPGAAVTSPAASRVPETGEVPGTSSPEVGPGLQAHALTPTEQDAMDSHDRVVGHPTLDRTDQLVFALLQHLGGDGPQARAQIAALLALSGAHLEQVYARLQQQDQAGAASATPAAGPAPDAQGHPTDACPHPPASPVPAAGRPSSSRAHREEPEDTFPVALGHYWPALAPACPLPEPANLLALENEYGRRLPLAVARHLLLTGRQLSDLAPPAAAWKDFVRACQEEAREPTYSAPTPAVPPARPRGPAPPALAVFANRAVPQGEAGPAEQAA